MRRADDRRRSWSRRCGPCRGARRPSGDHQNCRCVSNGWGRCGLRWMGRRPIACGWRLLYLLPAIGKSPGRVTKSLGASGRDNEEGQPGGGCLSIGNGGGGARGAFHGVPRLFRNTGRACRGGGLGAFAEFPQRVIEALWRNALSLGGRILERQFPGGPERGTGDRLFVESALVAAGKNR